MGFDAAGVVPAGPASTGSHLRAWLDGGNQAGMAWMGRNLEARTNPQVAWPGTRSLLVVAMEYQVEEPPPTLWNDPMRGRVARFAWGRDYHEELVPRLRELAASMAAPYDFSPDAARAYVDAGPLLEREWAVRSGLGFIGRNTMLIRPRAGSYCFLGALLLPIEIACSPAPELANAPCGRCKRCITACPTGALSPEGQLNSRKCLSYLTIEHRGDWPSEQAAGVGNWLFGCDACQEACPYNLHFARPAPVSFLKFDEDVATPRLEDILRMDKAAFLDRYRKTPLQRTGLARLQRNARVILSASDHPDAADLLAEYARENPDDISKYKAVSD